MEEEIGSFFFCCIFLGGGGGGGGDTRFRWKQKRKKRKSEGIDMNPTGTKVIGFSHFFYSFLYLCCLETRVRVVCFVCWFLVIWSQNCTLFVLLDS